MQYWTAGQLIVVSVKMWDSKLYCDVIQIVTDGEVNI